MVESQRVLLKCRMPIGHAGVAGVTGFGDQAQIGEGQGLDYLTANSSLRSVKPTAQVGIDKHQCEQQHRQA